MTYVQHHGTRLKLSHTEFFLSNHHIQTTSITKDLGAQFESNLKFKARINDLLLLIAPTSGQLLFISPSCHVTLIIWFWRSKLTSDPCSNTFHRCGPRLMSCWSAESALLRLSNSDLPRLLGMDLFRILNVWLSLDFNPWTATEFWTLMTDCVCSGSVVVTAYDSESGCPGSNPEWGQYTMRLRSLHRAYPSLHPSGVVHWVPEQLWLGHSNWLMVAALCCVRPHLQWYQLAYATEIKSIQLHDSIVMGHPIR